jgi:hypothetical protein
VIDRSSAARRPRRVPEARAHEILVRRHAEHVPEEPEEVKGAESERAGHVLEIDVLGRALLDPERGLDGPPSILLAGRRRRRTPPGHHVDEARREREPDLVEADVARAGRGCLRELAEHHQLRERRHPARPPEVGPPAERVDELRRQLERETLVADDVVVRAQVLVAGWPTSSAPATSSNASPRAR